MTKSSQEVLSEKIDEFFPTETVEVKKEETIEEVEESKEPEKAEEEKDVKKSENNEEEALEEVEADEKETQEPEDLELKKRLSGHPKEFRELVNSVKDKELQTKILEAGKIVRAREDRLSLELGNLKKDYTNVSGLLKFLDTNPAEAIKHIAKVVKIDLNNLVEKPVQDEYDYRTPEEIARDKQFEDIKRELQELRNQKSNDEIQNIEQEINSFAESLDSEGELKYPHFDKLQDSIFDILGIQRQKLGIPKTAQERKQRLEKAYQKALLLDDELVVERDADILRREKEKRLAEIEKAKKLKKFSGRSSSASVKPASSKEAMSEIFDKWAAGSL